MTKTDAGVKKLKINQGDLFVADIVGLGIYRMVKSGINNSGHEFANVELRKLFCQGFKWIGHVTNCHPINIDQWNNFKIINHHERKRN